MSAALVVTAPASAATMPTISSNTWAQQSLVATPVTAGDVLQWYQCDGTGANCVVDGTASASTSSPAVSAGDTYYVAETEASSPTPVDSATTSPIAASPPTASPMISGTVQVGDPLTAVPGAWSQTPDGGTATYTFQLCGATGCAAVASPWTFTSAADGDTLTFTQSASWGPTPLSATTSIILPTAPSARTSSPPTITGAAADGQTLTASVGSFSGEVLGTPTYQWLSCSGSKCTAISKATSATLKLGDSQVGSTIEVQVTASNTGGSATATSSRTTVVTAGSTLGLLVSPSSANINQTVRMAAIVTSGVSSVQPAGSVTFYNDGTPIPGCTDQSVPASDQSVTVVCPTSFGLSTPTITAAYTPGNGTPLTGSSSSSQSITVLSDQSTTTLDVPTIVKRGATVTYTANVAPADDLTGPVVPGGTVRFTNHGKTIRGCGAARISSGAATCTIHYRKSGRQRISAQYAGTASFAGSSSHIKTVRVVSALPVNHGQRPLGAITSTMQWTFHYTPTFTRILALTLHGLTASSTVTIDCSGTGCPYHRHTHLFTTGHPNFNLVHAFLHHKLGVKAKVVIMLTRHRYVGKYYRFTIKPRRQPAILISCLAPGSQRPGVGCES